MGIEGRVEDILQNVVGRSNKDRTAFYVDQAKNYAEYYDDVGFVEYKVPLSRQKGYALIIPPENKTNESEYVLVGGHIDSAPSLFNIIKKYRPGANDNGFAPAFLQAYVENLGEKRQEKGIIVAGFPHEEGVDMYRFIGMTALAYLAGLWADNNLGEYIPEIMAFVGGYVGSFELFDRIGGAFKLGLIGSAEPFKKVLEEELGLDLEKIICAMNLDMIGTAGKTTEVLIPYESPTMRPSGWIVPKKMDKSLIADIDCMLLYSLTETEDIGVEKLLINHHLLLGTSDHAELSKYINRAAGFIHVNNWRDLHTQKDKIEHLNLQNANWYSNFVNLLTTSLDKSWKTESQIEIMEEKGLISSEIEQASFYNLGEETLCLIRRPGDKEYNPLNILYSVEKIGDKYVTKDFLTYGIQDNPEDLINYPDSNLENWLDGKENVFEKKELEEELNLRLNSVKYSITRDKKNILDYTVRASSRIVSFVGDRSLAMLLFGMVGGGAYALNSVENYVNPATFTADHSLQLTEQLNQAYTFLETTSVLGKEALIIGSISVVAAAATIGFMKTLPYFKRQIRKLNVADGNRALDYNIIEN